MPNYKIKFIELELNKFNIIENETIRKSCMSIYMYMLKLIDTKRKKLLAADLTAPAENTLKISYREFLKKYIPSHDKLSLPTLKERFKLLLELGLITAKKFKNSFIYSFCRFCVNKKSNENSNIPKSTQSTGKHKLVKSTKKYKYLKLKLSLDLDSNNNPPEKKSIQDNFDMQKYLDSKEKVTDWDYINNLLKIAFENLKVRSTWIKEKVIDKLYTYYTTVTKEHAMSYICACIRDARTKYYASYQKYVLEENNAVKDSFTNYQQREYSSDQLWQLELKLRGY